MARATIDTGDKCVHCGEDTSFGSGRFVNRLGIGTTSDCVDWLPADIQAERLDVDGWGCAECSGFECDKCGEQIYLDEDVSDADGYHYHEKCLAPELQVSFD
jgi:hypothetical protein